MEVVAVSPFDLGRRFESLLSEWVHNVLNVLPQPIVDAFQFNCQVVSPLGFCDGLQSCTEVAHLGDEGDLRLEVFDLVLLVLMRVHHLLDQPIDLVLALLLLVWAQ